MEQGSTRRKLSSNTRESCKAFAYLVMPQKVSKTLVRKALRRVCVCAACRGLIIDLVVDCDPHNRNEVCRQIYGYLGRQKVTPSLVRAIYHALFTDSSDFIAWLEGQQVSRPIRKNVQQALPFSETDVTIIRHEIWPG